MKKEFYNRQPLIVKETGERVTFVYDDGDYDKTCLVLINGRHLRHDYYNYEDLVPSTEFKFSELMAGLEQGYFEVGTTFRRLSSKNILTVKESFNKLFLQGERELPSLTTSYIHSTWTLVGPHKEMTLEEIEDELGYKVKLIENSKETLPMDWI